VPLDGVKVRCSRCKHAFVVHPEGADPGSDEALHAVAERAAESGGVPDVTEDAPVAEDAPEFAGGAPVTEAAPEFAGDAPVAEAPPEFAEDLPGSEDAVEAAPEASADPTLEEEEVSWEFGDGFDELSSEADEVEEEPAFGVGTDAGAESGLELASESSSDLGLDADPSPEPESDAQPDPSTVKFSDEESGDVATAVFDDQASEVAAAADGEAAAEDSDPLAALGGAEAEADAADELGSPMDWDIFGDESEDAVDDEVSDRGHQPERRKPWVAPIEDEEAQIDPKQLQLRRAGLAAGWLATAGLCLAGLLPGLTPTPAAIPIQADLGPGLQLEQLAGSWVDHLSLGPVFAVRGRVRNGDAVAQPLPPLEVVWRDRAGAAVGRPTPLSAPRGPVELREDPRVTAVAGSGLAGARVQPGGDLPFEAVAQLPYETDRFEVRVAP